MSNGMRRANETLNECVIGNLNESGVNVLVLIPPRRDASVASGSVV